MLCINCNKKIEYTGAIKDGKPYHLKCLCKVETQTKKDTLLQLSQISGVDEYLMQYFNNNPLDTKKAIKNKNFALVGVYEKNSCSSGSCVLDRKRATQKNMESEGSCVSNGMRQIIEMESKNGNK